MTDFSLIKQLNSSSEENEKTPLPKGLPYQQYEVVVENASKIVNIPLKETKTFEQMLSKFTNLTAEDLNKILRKVRGIRG